MSRELRVWVRKQFPNLPRKEFRALLAKSEIEIREAVAAKKALEERKRIEWEENYRLEQERIALENEDPLIKFMRGVLSVTTPKPQELKRVEGCVVAPLELQYHKDG